MHTRRTLAPWALMVLLAACASGKENLGSLADPGSSIAIIGPAGGALKLGRTARFVAVFKAPDGTSVFGKSFQWTSQNPDIAEVTADGRVTAKRLGSFRVSAESEGVTGSSEAQYTYGLEVAGGTFNEGGPALGAAILVRLRGPNGQPPEANTPISVTGPDGFNGNAAVVGTYRAGRAFDWTVSRAPPVAGTYTVTAVVGDETLEGRFQSAFATKLTPASRLEVLASTARVDASWAAVPGAKGYAAVVWRQKGSTLERLLETYTTGTTATLNAPGGLLEPGGSYVLTLFATTGNLGGDGLEVGALFDVALNARPFVPAPASPRLGRFAGRWKASGPGRVAALEVVASGTDAILEVKEACARPDCAWAPTRGTVFWATPDPAADAPATAISAVVVTATTRTTLLVQPSGTAGLSVTTLTEFVDGSGRAAYAQTDSLEREAPPTAP